MNKTLKDLNEDMLVEFANLCFQYPNEARANLWEEVVDRYYPLQPTVKEQGSDDEVDEKIFHFTKEEIEKIISAAYNDGDNGVDIWEQETEEYINHQLNK